MTNPLRYPTRRVSHSRPPPPPTQKSYNQKSSFPSNCDIPTSCTPPSPLSLPPSSPPRRRYTRSNLLVFRAASGEETNIHQSSASLSPSSSSPMEDNLNLAPDLTSIKPRISSVTASSRASSPQTTNPDFFQIPSEDHNHSVLTLKSQPILSRLDYVNRRTSIATEDDDEEEIAPRRHTTLRTTKNLLTQLRRKRILIPRRNERNDTNQADEDEETQYNEIDDEGEDCESVYSHASAVNVDDIDHPNTDNRSKQNQHRFLKRLPTTARDIHKQVGPVVKSSTTNENESGDRPNEKQMPPVTAAQIREIRELRRQSFASSFARAREAKARRAVVLARPELQPHNRSRTLLERCVSAIAEVLDMHMEYAADALERFEALATLFTEEERTVIAEVMWEASLRTRNEAPVPWRTPLRPPLPNGRAKKERPSASISILKAQRESSNRKKLFVRGRAQSSASNDTLLRSVVYGAHVIPGAQSAEGILLRMAGEYQREEINRRASRAERLNIPLSFAMTLAGMIATFSRLECHVSYRKHRSRSASNRRGSPQALILLKTKYDGIRLSFAVTLHGDSPCTVLFRRPRVFSMRKIDEYATLVTEAKDILTEYGREISAPKQDS